MVDSPAYPSCSVIFFAADLVTLTGVEYLLLRLIVGLLIASADILWPDWDPGPSVHRPSIRHELRQRLR